MLNEQKIAEILSLDGYENLVRSVCRQAVQNPVSTYLLMERYAYINGFAGSGVALLSGNIGYSRELFTDKGKAAPSSSDKGMLIAARVFSATVDEHADAQRGHAPHRALAQACIGSIAAYAGLDVRDRQSLDCKSAEFLGIVEKFKNNYRGEAGDFPALMQALGYHVASEFLADREYRITDEEIWFNNPDERFRHVVRRGRKPDGTWYGPWAWVTAHGHSARPDEGPGHGVEHDHYLDAMEAVNLAVRFRPHGISEQEVLAQVTEGMRRFRENWTAFYTCAMNEMDTALIPEKNPSTEPPEPGRF